MNTVLSIVPVTPAVFKMTVRSLQEGTYQIPGQYVVVRAPGFKEGYYSIASSPGEDWLFLIKKDSLLSEHLSQSSSGSSIDMSPAQGKGFNLKACEGRDVYCFAGGTGITPIRPVLRELIAHRDRYGKIHLLFGVSSAADFYFEDEFEEWKKNGVTITQTVEPPDPAWSGKTGFVQNHLGVIDPSRATALLCGPKPLVDDVRKVLLQRGLTPDVILTNY